MTSTDGKAFEGQWKGGQQNGLGKLIEEDGEVSKYGVWEAGKLKNGLTYKKWEELHSEL